MIVERSMHPQFLSNTYLVGDEPGGSAVIVDAGSAIEPLVAQVDENDLTVTHILLTHHHYDHVSEVPALLEHYDVPVLIHPLERELVETATGTLDGGEKLTSGGLEIEALHTPGHTSGMLALVVNGGDCFTGDTLFKGSVGGVRAPNSTSFEDLRHSVMEVLMKLPPTTTLHPGHTDPTTVGDEWEQNAFIRLWRGLDQEGTEGCTVFEQHEPATLVLFGDDYDGGHKAWVRWPDGRDDIVPGSQVERAAA